MNDPDDQSTLGGLDDQSPLLLFATLFGSAVAVVALLFSLHP